MAQSTGSFLRQKGFMVPARGPVTQFVEPLRAPGIPLDVLYDGARVTAILDIRRMLGDDRDAQKALTFLLMDHDLSNADEDRQDYLIPGVGSPAWLSLPVSEEIRMRITDRLQWLPWECLSHPICFQEAWLWVGPHRMWVRDADVKILSARWLPWLDPERKSLEIARLLALYSIFDNPQHERRNGVHLGLEPEFRRTCEYELFASPLNAAVANGYFASKWPHVEWQFGAMGSYPTALDDMPSDAIVCVNPPFTDAYLADVMRRLPDLKKKCKLCFVIPVLDAAWRASLSSELQGAELCTHYFDASSERYLMNYHPTLLWQDPSLERSSLWKSTATPSLASPSPATSSSEDELFEREASVFFDQAETDCIAAPTEDKQPPEKIAGELLNFGIVGATVEPSPL